MRDRRWLLRALRAEAGNVANVAAAVPWTTVVAAVAFAVLLVAWWLWFRAGSAEDEAADEEQGKEFHSNLTPRQIAAMKADAESGRVKDSNMFGRHSSREHDGKHGVLETNFQTEGVVRGNTHMFEYSKMGMSSAHTKMLYYDVDRTTGWSSLFHLTHTCIVDSHLWRTCSVYLVLGCVLALCTYLLRGARSQWDVSQSVDLLANAAFYLSALLGFMLGLFVSEIISRWWRCRMECVDVLWSAISDITMLLSVKCPDPADAPFKETILRLGLLSHRLVYYEARGQEDREHLQHLIHVGLLTEEELDALDGQTVKSQLVLVWIGRLYSQLGAKRQWSAQFLATLNDQLRRARSAIGKIFAYCTTQLPYQYVHLLSFCVLLCNLLITSKCGLTIGQSLSAKEPMYIRAVMQVFQLVVEPFAYHAFLRLCSELSNPFGHDFSDFPGFAYHCYIRSEGFALHKAGERPPPNLIKLTA